MQSSCFSSWFRVAVLLVLVKAASDAADPTGITEWVRRGADGRLMYKTTARGDRILDFSAAGYAGGGVALPDVPAVITLRPSGSEDDSAAIQAALDEVGRRPLKNGFRGAVQLAPGVFTCSQTLRIAQSGVVLRGSGSGPEGTHVRMTGTRHRAVIVGPAPTSSNGLHENEDQESEMDEAVDRKVSREPAAAAINTRVVDGYVPAGARSFTLADASGLAVGDDIVIRRPVTPAWVEFMQMHNLRRDGRPQTWLGAGRASVMRRRVTALAGTTVTVDIPLADSLDAALLAAEGVRVSKAERRTDSIERVGVERLHFQCPPLETAYGAAPYSGITVGGDDCWVRDVYFEETMNTVVLAGHRITVQEVVVFHTHPNLGPSKPTDFSIEGSQILIDRCRVTGDNEYFVWTAGLHPGPNVVLNSTFNGRGSRLQPHMRWSTGLLVDNCRVPDGGIDFPNRGVAGSGHGWTMGWAVAWNCEARNYVIQNPPGALNWAIGCVGERWRWPRYFDRGPLLDEGTFDSHGKPVSPRSLYLAQLLERSGEAALRAVGYASADDAQLTPTGTQPLAALESVVDPELGTDLAIRRPLEVRRPSGGDRHFAAENVVDGDPATYWVPTSGRPRGSTGRPTSIVVDTEGPLTINAVLLAEARDREGRVKRYRVEGQVDSDWHTLAEGTQVGARQVLRFAPVTVWKVRLTLLETDPEPGIATIGLFSVAARTGEMVGGTN